MKKLVLHSYPWGTKITPIPKRVFDTYKECKPVHLAVIHAFVWKKGCGYPGAPQETYYTNYLPALAYHTAAVFGDNHTGFHRGKIFNAGGLIRRRSDELEYRPRVGVLLTNGEWKTHYLDTSKDKFRDPEDTVRVLVDEATDADDPGQRADFLKDLASLVAKGASFRKACLRYLDSKGVAGKVRDAVLELTEGPK